MKNIEEGEYFAALQKDYQIAINTVKSIVEILPISIEEVDLGILSIVDGLIDNFLPKVKEKITRIGHIRGLKKLNKPLVYKINKIENKEIPEMVI